MANHVSHASLPYPVRGCRYTIQIPFLDADGDPTDPTTPDTERSIDGAAFADCTEEVTTITGSNGVGYITLTGDETNASMVAVAAKVASGPKATLATLNPRVLPVIFSGTATAGAAGSITLSATNPPLTDDLIVGCIIRTTGGTGGGGGSGSLGNQARVITDYVASTRVVSVSPNWETNPSSDTAYEVLLTDNALIRYSDVQTVRGSLLNALVSGRMDASVGAMASGTITAAAIATGAFDADAIAADAFTASKFASDCFTAAKFADGFIDAASLATDMDGYTGKLSVIDDDTGDTDRWVIVWHKNGVPLSAGITSPTIQVVKLSDGTDLVAETAMTQVGSTHFFQKTEGTNRIVDGAAYGAVARATIGGVTRVWTQVIGRPS